MLLRAENVAVQPNSVEAENAEHHRYSPPPGELVEQVKAKMAAMEAGAITPAQLKSFIDRVEAEDEKLTSQVKSY